MDEVLRVQPMFTGIEKSRERDKNKSRRSFDQKSPIIRDGRSRFSFAVSKYQNIQLRPQPWSPPLNFSMVPGYRPPTGTSLLDTTTTFTRRYCCASIINGKVVQGWAFSAVRLV